MKHIFIVNPISGGGHALKIMNNIKYVCEERDLEYEIRVTTGPNDATNIAKEYINNEYIIYSVGGDGTMNEVLNGLVGSNNKFGIIPAGSGNDFSRLLKSNEKEDISIDIGKINSRYFINIVCIGIDAEVAHNVTLMKDKNIPPKHIYNFSLLYTFFKYKFKNLKLTLNNNLIEDSYTLLSICNGKYYGGGFKIAPKSDFQDGLFDIYLARKTNKLKIPNLLLKLIKGTHETSPLVKREVSKEIFISSKEDIICNVDGENLIAKDFKVSIIENGIIIYNNQQLINEFLSYKVHKNNEVFFEENSESAAI